METELHIAQNKGMRFIRRLFSLKNVALPLLAVGLLLAACSDDPTSTDPDPDPITVDAAFTVSPEEPSLGETVTLDAGNSSVTGSNDIEYSWTLSVPGDSNAELDDPTSSTTTFEADVEGEFEVSLEVSAEGESDSANMAFEVRAVEEINSNITEPTNWVSNVLYIVTDGFQVRDELTIEPGTRIEFEVGTEMVVSEDGTLIADGTEQDSIRFTGTEEVRGHWNGIQFNTTQSTSNLLNYVIVEYGGNSGFWRTQDTYSNVLVGSRTEGTSARVQITNSTLREADGVGLKVRNDSELRDSGNNTYIANSEGAVHIDAKRVHNLSDNSDFTGNDNDVVWVDVGSPLDDEDRIWQAINVPYVINDEVEVRNVDFTIEAGGEYRFESAAALSFTGDGVFTVEGTDREHENGNHEGTLFTGTEQDPGWWRGIQLQGATNPNNSMADAIIEYAGHSDGFWGTHSNLANLVIGGRTSRALLSVTNTTLRHGGGYGLRISDEDSDMRNSGANTFTENNSGAAYVYANNIHYLDSGSDYSGNNGNDFVFVEDSDVEGGAVVWNALNVPYRMDSLTEVVGNTELTILAGAQFEFTSGSGLRSGGETVFVVDGNENNPVLFTGTEEDPGWWMGINIVSPQSGNSIEHAIFQYGGGDDFWNASYDAMLVIGGRTTEGQATVTDSEFNFSGEYGIWVTDEGEANDDICTANSFDNNQEGDCLVED